VAHEAGKGDNRRPEDKKAFDEGYDRIFGKKRPEEAIDVINKLQKELYETDKPATSS
jgi:uncharacterized protein with von Willebrand factor type A (vWA) domain